MRSSYLRFGLVASTTDFLLTIQYSQAVSQGAQAAPGPVVVDAQRFVYAASENSVTKYSAAGSPVWVASRSSAFFIAAIAVDLSGNVYAVSAGTIRPNETLVAKVNADGTVAGPGVMLGAGLDAAPLAVGGNGHLRATGRMLPTYRAVGFAERPEPTLPRSCESVVPHA